MSDIITRYQAPRISVSFTRLDLPKPSGAGESLKQEPAGTREELLPQPTHAAGVA